MIAREFSLTRGAVGAAATAALVWVCSAAFDGISGWWWLAVPAMGVFSTYYRSTGDDEGGFGGGGGGDGD